MLKACTFTLQAWLTICNPAHAREFDNGDIMAPWNDSMLQDDFMAPWNDPMYQDDYMAPWNDPMAGADETNEYLDDIGADSSYYWQ